MSFNDPAAVARYAEGPPRLVPGFHDMQRMARLLVAESVGRGGEVLVLGAGGGLELSNFAAAEPGWRFVGVDPSAPMLDLARQTAAPFMNRITLIEGLIDAAPDGPFDAATAILVLHFIPRAERLETLRQLHRRLKPGAPLVVAHHSYPQGHDKDLWLRRFAAFAASSGVPEADAAKAGKGIGEMLPALAPEDDELLMREAGFTDVSLFYAAFTFRGWIARR